MVDLEIGRLLATIEADGRQAILVEIAAALGSTPRGGRSMRAGRESS